MTWIVKYENLNGKQEAICANKQDADMFASELKHNFSTLDIDDQELDCRYLVKTIKVLRND